MAKRLTRKLTDVAVEVEDTICREFNITQSQIQAMRNRAHSLGLDFPVSHHVRIDELWIDYEVQRDVIHKHVLTIMKRWDPRICSPGSACRILGRENTYLYDAQHRTLAAAILGYDSVPCAVVETDDPNFPSYAFELLNETGVKRLTPGDLHRNSLVRYKNGSRDIRVVRARVMQDQFDTLGIDLEDKNTRKSTALRGTNHYFFSHFKYAQKALDLEPTRGSVLFRILDAVKTVFPGQDEIDQGVFIGLYELQRLAGTETRSLPDTWMTDLLRSVATIWPDSHVVHAKGKAQWTHYKGDGATWTAPTAMANFLREVHRVRGGSLDLPYHGDGSKMGVEEGVIAPGLF